MPSAKCLFAIEIERQDFVISMATKRYNGNWWTQYFCHNGEFSFLQALIFKIHKYKKLLEF